MQSCLYCGDPPSRIRGDYLFNGIDRLENKLGYVRGNVVPCCFRCNRAKADDELWAFLEWRRDRLGLPSVAAKLLDSLDVLPELRYVFDVIAAGAANRD